jgi:hypothetical protein
MKDETITAINETAKTAGATVENAVKNELFGAVKTVVEPSVAKKVAKRALIGAGILALAAGGFYGYKAMKKTKTIVVITSDDAQNDATTETPAEETAA